VIVIIGLFAICNLNLNLFVVLFCQLTNLPEICFARQSRIAFAWGWFAETSTRHQPVLSRDLVDYSET
jgi:hypothetical protein